MSKNQHIFISVAILGVLILGGWFFLSNDSEQNMDSTAISIGNALIIEKDAEKTDKDSLPQDSVVENTKSIELPLTYINEQFGFTLGLPEGYTGSSFVEGDGVKVQLNSPDGSQDFQIFILPFDEQGPLTATRIKQDLPDLVIENPLNVMIAGGEVTALIFESSSEEFGETREVWFLAQGQLFQVIAPLELEQTIGRIMESLRFESR